MTIRRAFALLGIAVVVAGCSDDSSTTPAATSPANETALAVGDAATFHRKSDQLKIGTFAIKEIAAVSAECVIDPIPAGGQVIAVRAEIVNDGELMLPRHDTYSIKAVDSGGFTQNVDIATVKSTCETRYPEIAASQAPGKTTGWATFQIAQANPTAVVYAPWVTDTGSTISNLKFAELTPPLATFKVAGPLSTGPAGTATTTAPPATTSPTAAPRPTGAQKTAGRPCDLMENRWATDASGGQLHCAYTGGETPTWVESLPYIGVREVGSPCQLGAYVAQSPTGVTMVCIGEQGAGTWAPGP